jgi:hypothetical protein
VRSATTATTGTIATTGITGDPASISISRRAIIGIGVIGTIGITTIGDIRQSASMEQGGS